jgi:hypothetical protein
MSEEIELKYRSPKPDKASFNVYWRMFLPDIDTRENLKASHLNQLRILCDLSVEYDELQEIIDLEGRTYLSVGRNGDQIKLRPEIQQLNRCVSEIRNYSKMLGLVLVKDTKMNKEDEKNDFD